MTVLPAAVGRVGSAEGEVGRLRIVTYEAALSGALKTFFDAYP